MVNREKADGVGIITAVKAGETAVMFTLPHAHA